jgi:hypothetical protein
MGILDTIFWFRKGNESVSVIKPKTNITKFTFENAEISHYFKGSSKSDETEISFNYDNKYYKFTGAELLPKVARAYKKASAKEKVVFSAILEVEDYNVNICKGTIVKVSKLK